MSTLGTEVVQVCKLEQTSGSAMNISPWTVGINKNDCFPGRGECVLKTLHILE